MEGEHVDCFLGDEPIDDAIRPKNNIADRRVGVLQNHTARLGKISESINYVQETADHDAGVVGRVDFDERSNGCEISLRGRSRKSSSREKALLDLVVTDYLARA